MTSRATGHTDGHVSSMNRDAQSACLVGSHSCAADFDTHRTVSGASAASNRSVLVDKVVHANMTVDDYTGKVTLFSCCLLACASVPSISRPTVPYILIV